MSKVLVAMSGGVDSSVAALVLLSAGCDVSGATMRLFPGDDSNIDDARSVCGGLGIAHYVFDFSDAFRRCVLDRFAAVYRAGKTPNPCIDCNRDIKFGEFLERGLTLGYDYVATGHYARVGFDGSSGRVLLKKAKDHSKDQSYVLYSLTQAQLGRTLLPLGENTKAEIRALAEEKGLCNSQKPDSQDICFVKENYRKFIELHTGEPARAGDFTDSCGNVLGRHNGIEGYTVGQRKGIGIAAGQPLYVCKKDGVANTVTLGAEGELYSKTLTARGLNLIATEKLTTPVRAAVRTRYNGVEHPATVHQLSETEAFIEFDEPQRAISPGQAAVFYDGDIVIGGGTIC